MYKLIFYTMESTNIMKPTEKEISFSVAIEDEKTFVSEASIFQVEFEMPEVFSITRTIDVETLEKAHYMCMALGYTISGPDNQLQNSTFAEYHGLHKCGSLEKEYEAKIGKKDVKTA